MFHKYLFFLDNISCKNVHEKSWPNIYLGQDPEPDRDVFKSRIRIRSKLVRIRNTGFKYRSRITMVELPNAPPPSHLFIMIVDRSGRKLSGSTVG
jgi:hypothetical protein